MDVLIPACETRVDIKVLNSRFFAFVAPVFSVEEAKAFIARIKGEFPDANHHVPAYLIGHGASVVAHCSDDGEPSGTAGRPVLTVLQGTGLGDVAMVIVRYFGGTKLGTGGLVRAYGDSAKAVLEALPRAAKVPTHTVMMAIPYSWFEQIRLMVGRHKGHILEEDFGADVTLTVQFAVVRFPDFEDELREFSNGSAEVEILETNESTILPLTEEES